ncbi:hypothetical protein [Marinobacter sp. AL4B]|uniref:hypothetical protein n=1 Tax=Marinobacter sp. AL4B TaxID=2871173 RepID=UPI001CAA65E1|nr:hypothetical protein [Marinobacter sp. AL4B]MBZ0335302.1 hypothetical protein [Marinobacter sp. AL4B]
MSLEEFRDRLQRQKEQDKPNTVFPEGCYGASNAPLVFVGPSPGGGEVDAEYSARNFDANGAYWNFEFNEPFEEWSNGFRTSLKPIVETVLQLPLSEGSNKLFAFVNFDWIQNPDSSQVPMSRVNEGKAVVLKVLKEIQPRIIVALDTKAYKALVQVIKIDYCLVDLKSQNVRIRTASPNSYHREVKAHLIEGHGELNGSVFLKSPQHPARIYNADYAERVSITLRKAYEAVVNSEELCVHLD